MSLRPRAAFHAPLHPPTQPTQPTQRGVGSNRIEQVLFAGLRVNAVTAAPATPVATGVSAEERQQALSAVQYNGDALQFVPESLKADYDIVLAAVTQNYGQALQWAHEDLKKDRAIVLAAVKQDGARSKDYPSNMPPRLVRSIAFNPNTVQPAGSALQWAHEDLKKDYEIVLAAVLTYGVALRWAHESLQQDRGIVVAAINQDGNALQWAHEDFKKDRDIVIAAVLGYGDALQFAHEYLKKDRYIVLAAVQRSWTALYFADESLKRDREFVRTAVQHQGYSIKYAHNNFKNDREIVLAAVKQDGMALSLVDSDLRADREIVLAAVTQHGFALRWADESLKKDRDIVHTAVEQNGLALREAHNLLKVDREIVLAAVKQDGRTLKIVHEDLRNDPEVRLAAATAKKNPSLTIMSAILHDIGHLLTTNTDDETDDAKEARMKRLDAYQGVLEKLAAVPVLQGGDLDTKLQELTELINDPVRNRGLRRHQDGQFQKEFDEREEDARDLIRRQDEDAAEKVMKMKAKPYKVPNKRQRTAEAAAFAAGFAMSRQPVFLG